MIRCISVVDSLHGSVADCLNSQSYPMPSATLLRIRKYENTLKHATPWRDSWNLIYLFPSGT